MKQTLIGLWRHLRAWGSALGIIVAASTAVANPADETLIEHLRAGGLTLYFRHAETDWSQQDHVSAAGDWRSCDGSRVRQLSDEGRAAALRALRIPVGRVLSSEYCRAVETAQLMAVGSVETTLEIMNMRAADLMGGRAAVIARAHGVLARRPPAGANVVIVAHGNLMRAATGAYPSEASSGVFAADPTAGNGFRLIAELTAADWTRLADRFAAGD